MNANEAITVAANLRFVTCMDIFAYALLVYDYFITLDSEILFMWPGEWTLVKCIFFVNRYLPFVDASMVLYHQLHQPLSENECRTLYFVTGWMFIFGIGLTELVLVIRTWALYDKSPKLGGGLVVYFLSFWIAICYTLSNFLESLRFLSIPSFPVPGCIIIGANEYLTVDWILLMVFEAGILLLMLNKAYRIYRTGPSSSIVRVVYRDGIMYYIYIYVLSLVNLIYVRTQSRALVVVLSLLQRVVHSILTTRLLLGIRRQVAQLRPSLGPAVQVEGLGDVMAMEDVTLRIRGLRAPNLV